MTMRGVCLLQSTEGVGGAVEFIPGDGKTRVVGKVTGLAPGKHGFHVHMWGDLSNGCTSTGGHFNPANKNHGGPHDEERHAGDLGNITAGDDGVASVDLEDAQIALEGARSVIGRAIVVHALEDDLGKGGDAESLKTGNAGGRLACGVIAMAPASSQV